MRLSDFNFPLPEDRIALRPASPRDAARLLVVRPGGLEDRVVRDLPDLLEPGDALVFNDTRVIAARLSGWRPRDDGGVEVEATLHKRLSPERWTAFMKPGKRLKAGDRVLFGSRSDTACELERLDATVEAKGDDGEVTLAFDFAGDDTRPGDRAARRHAAAAVHRRAARRGRARFHRLPDRLCPHATARSRRRPRACISRPS